MDQRGYKRTEKARADSHSGVVLSLLPAPFWLLAFLIACDEFQHRHRIVEGEPLFISHGEVTLPKPGGGTAGGPVLSGGVPEGVEMNFRKVLVL
jgi:hypothetical protein